MHWWLGVIVGSVWVVSVSAGERVAPRWDDLSVGIFSVTDSPSGLVGRAEARATAVTTELPPMVASVGYETATGFSVGLEGAGPEDRGQFGSPGLARRLDALRSDWAASDRQRLERLNRDGLWHRAADTVLPEPTAVRAGRFQFGGGAVNAVKQRNPFALLSEFPVLFWLSF